MKSLSKIIKRHESPLHEKEFDIFFSEERLMDDPGNQNKHHEYIKQHKMKAREEAEIIINEAKKQAIAEHQSGFEEGLRKGLEKLKPLEEMLRDTLTKINHFAEQYPHQLEPKVVNLILHIASKIIKDKLESDRNIVIRTVQDTFKEITDKEYIKIRVHCEDIALMRKFQPQLLEMFHDIKKIEIVADDIVDKGGCIIETNEGRVDATIKTQLQKLYGAITDETFASRMYMTS
ncbi:MAG: hypothetical protein KKH94_13360 [Candidatus Omnitrophica bacterium]|nr:hypothetical protein [Candidatus Omnitrophota bacterium]